MKNDQELKCIFQNIPPLKYTELSGYKGGYQLKLIFL